MVVVVGTVEGKPKLRRLRGPRRESPTADTSPVVGKVLRGARGLNNQ